MRDPPPTHLTETKRDHRGSEHRSREPALSLPWPDVGKMRQNQQESEKKHLERKGSGSQVKEGEWSAVLNAADRSRRGHNPGHGT